MEDDKKKQRRTQRPTTSNQSNGWGSVDGELRAKLNHRKEFHILATCVKIDKEKREKMEIKTKLIDMEHAE